MTFVTEATAALDKLKAEFDAFRSEAADELAEAKAQAAEQIASREQAVAERDAQVSALTARVASLEVRDQCSRCRMSWMHARRDTGLACKWLRGATPHAPWRSLQYLSAGSCHFL